MTCQNARVRHCDRTRTLACHIYETSSFSRQSCQLSFFEARFWNSVFFNIIGFFRKSKKAWQNVAFSGFFWARKAWLWQNIVWAAYSLQISSDESLWPCRVHKHRILQDFTVAVKWSMLLVRNKCMTVQLRGKKMLLKIGIVLYRWCFWRVLMSFVFGYACVFEYMP